RQDTAPALVLVARAQRKSLRTRIHQRPAQEQAGVYTGRRLRRAALRAILQREQVRGRNGSLRGVGKCARAICHRSVARERARILDGWRERLASRNASRGAVVRGIARRRVRGNGDLRKGVRSEKGTASLVGADALADVRRD